VGSIYVAALIFAKSIGANPTAFAYGAVVVGTLIQAARYHATAALLIRKTDGVAIACGVGSLAIALVVQWLAPLCLGICSPIGGTGSISLADIVLANVLAPIAESILVQGWCYEFACFLLGRGRLAVLMTAVLFIAIHLSITIPLVVSAFVLAMIRHRTHSLGSPIVVHFIFNFAVTVLYLSKY
jgi:membrane protease YdiL (CAAX protease family)